jgi:hypothetical protein
MWIIDLLVICPSPHFGAPTCPSTPKVLRTRECTLTPCPSINFTFKLAVKSIKEFGGASIVMFGYGKKLVHCNAHQMKKLIAIKVNIGRRNLYCKTNPYNWNINPSNNTWRSSYQQVRIWPMLLCQHASKPYYDIKATRWDYFWWVHETKVLQIWIKKPWRCTIRSHYLIYL